MLRGAHPGGAGTVGSGAALVVVVVVVVVGGAALVVVVVVVVEGAAEVGAPRLVVDEEPDDPDELDELALGLAVGVSGPTSQRFGRI